MTRSQAFLRGKCPHCRQGKIFRSFWRMNQYCPHCQIQFEREAGFFLMSIYMGYAVDMIIVAPILVIMILKGFAIEPILKVVVMILLPLTPLVFRLTRLIWLYLDDALDPRQTAFKEMGNE